MIHFESFFKYFKGHFEGQPEVVVLPYAWAQYVLLVDGARDGQISDAGCSAWLEACKEVEAEPGF